MSESLFSLVRGLSWPNRISLLRLLGVLPFVMLLLNQHDWPEARYYAMGIFGLMGISDYLDGYLARKTGQITRLGSILDPLADKVLITCSAILLATDFAHVPGARLPSWVAVSIVGKDLWVVLGFLVIHLVTGRVKIHPTRAGKVCTAGQIIMVAGVLLAPDINRLGDHAGSLMAQYMGYAVVALCLIAIASYTRLGLMMLSQHESHPAGPKPLENDKNHAV